MKWLGKKGQTLNMGLLSGLVGVAVIFVIVTVIMAFGADVTSDVGADFEADSYADNITDNGLSGMDEIAQKLPTIGLIIAIGIIIALLLGFLGFAAARRIGQ